MPNQSPVSRYLLVGIAALMLGSVLPDLELLLHQARQWQAARRVRTVQRVVVIDGMEWR